MTKTTGNAAAVRTPGEDAPKSDADEGAGVNHGAAEGNDGADAEPAKPAKKLTLEQRLDLLEEENARLRAGQAAPAKVDPTVDLPDVSEFTGKNQHKQKELTGAVLTKQGWLAPAHLGSSPVLHELQKQGLSATGGR